MSLDAFRKDRVQHETAAPARPPPSLGPFLHRSCPAAALLIYLAELALQFRDLLFDAFYKLFVGNAARQLPIPHDFHFEFHAFVF
jgi:hypothetical protein